MEQIETIRKELIALEAARALAMQAVHDCNATMLKVQTDMQKANQACMDKGKELEAAVAATKPVAG